MTYAFYDNEEHNTYTMLVSFYLAARFRTLVHYLATGFLLPMIRGVMICEAINVLIPSVLWIASIHVEMPSRLGLIWVALALDMWGQSIITGLFRYGRMAGEKSGIGKFLAKVFEFYPAVNIEHRVERTNAFVSLVFGYSVVGVMFQSYGGYHVNSFLGKAVLGLVQAFVFNWIYFDVDGSNIDIHAIRRSIVSGKCFLFIFKLSTNSKSHRLELCSSSIHHGLHPCLCWTIQVGPGNRRRRRQCRAIVGALLSPCRG